MPVDEIGPVPPGVTAGASSGQVFGILNWFNKMLDRIQRAATTTKRGGTLQAEAQPDSTAATVADLRTDFNALLAKLRAAEQMDS